MISVREWLSHYDKDPEHRITLLSDCGNWLGWKYVKNSA